MRHRRALLRRRRFEISFDLECGWYDNIGSRDMSSSDFSIMASILDRDTYKFSSKHVPILRPDGPIIGRDATFGASIAKLNANKRDSYFDFATAETRFMAAADLHQHEYVPCRDRYSIWPRRYSGLSRRKPYSHKHTYSKGNPYAKSLKQKEEKLCLRLQGNGGKSKGKTPWNICN